jgi:transposase
MIVKPPLPTFEEFESLPRVQRRELFNRLIGLIPRVEALEAQLAKNSSNSSKPPSSDGLKKTPQTQSSRQPSGKKPGGQPGHVGASLVHVDVVDLSMRHDPQNCGSCGKSLEGKAIVQTEARQVFDLPKLDLLVTEHLASTKRCSCGALTCGAFPGGVEAPVQYGSNVKGLAVYMSTYQFLPLARLGEFFSDLFGAKLSPATILSMVAKTASSVEQTVEAIKNAVIRSALAHFDETGLRCESRLMWLHSASNAKFTHYAVSLYRGSRAIDEIGILPFFRGNACHDAFASYFNYEECGHSLCNAHHLRELKFIYEQYGELWAKQMLDLLLRIKKAVDQRRTDGHASLTIRQLEKFDKKYDAILASGRRLHMAKGAPERVGKRGRKAQHKGKNLLDRLSFEWQMTLAFMYDFSIPFTNNQAERDIRMQKVKEKISGCFRTLASAKKFACIRSYISTARKQGHRILEALHAAAIGRPLALATHVGT